MPQATESSPLLPNSDSSIINSCGRDTHRLKWIAGILTVAVLYAFVISRYYGFPYLNGNDRALRAEFDPTHNSYQVYDSVSQDYLATGFLRENVEEKGWNYLSMTTRNLTVEVDEDYFHVMRALGYLEGFLTCELIDKWYVNFYSGLFDGANPTHQSVDFLLENHDWMTRMSNNLWKDSDYWTSARGVLAQLDGIVDGAREKCHPPAPWSLYTTVFGSAAIEKSKEGEYHNGIHLASFDQGIHLVHFLLMNANGDLYQIAEKYDQADQPIEAASDGNTNKRLLRKLPIEPHDPKKPPGDGDERNDEDGRGGGARDKGPLRIAEPVPTMAPSPSLSQIYRPQPVLSPSLQDVLKRITNMTMQWPNEDWRSHLPGPMKRRAQHCSALIKLLPNSSDIVFGHNTWDDFQLAGPRIIKHYSQALRPSTHLKDKDKERGKSSSSSKDRLKNDRLDMQFSSSPGMLSSVDDFYTVRGRGHIAVTETTIDSHNPALLDLVVPELMLSWMRVRIANEQAVDGKDWATLFGKHHSGTYIDQWMVIDFTKFIPGKALQAGLLTVLEEIPGLIHSADMTAHLQLTGYWASYNNPYFDDISIQSGNTDLCLVNPINCHATDPRALIFEELQGSVVDLESLRAVMTYNRFQTDPLALNNSCNAIACRLDLQPIAKQKYPFGAIDAKISSILSNSNGEAVMQAYLGPTRFGQEAFCWSKLPVTRNRRGKLLSHVGQPDCFDFDWMEMPPVSLRNQD